MSGVTNDGSGPQQLSTLLKSPSIAIVSIDLSGVVTHWSVGAERLFGYSAREITGRNWSLLAPARTHAELNKALAKIRRGRTLPDSETRRQRKDGSEFDAQFAIYALTDDNGESIVGAVTITTDISARKVAEAARAESAGQLQAIVKSALDGIITIDQEGTIDAINPAAQALFGYRAHELIGHNVNVLMPDPFHSEHDQYIRNYLQTGVAKIIGIGREVSGKRKNGEIFPMELAVSTMQVQGRLAFVGIVKDISEQKRHEQALQEQIDKTRRSNVELEKTLEQLRQTQQQLIESEKMASLGALVAGVAHEINTPLGISVTAASYLSDIARDTSRAFATNTLKHCELTRFLDTSTESSQLILNNLERASRLIKSFKEVAVDQSRDKDREINLAEYFDEILASMTPELKRANIRVNLDCPGNIRLTTNPGALYQIINNLVINAKLHAYSSVDGGEVCISVECTSSEMHLRVQDWGVGIAEGNVAHIFDPFFTTRRGEGGTGLGLHVTYNLVTQSLGGDIRVETQVGKGSTFIVKFPVRDYHEVAHTESASGLSPSEHP